MERSTQLFIFGDQTTHFGHSGLQQLLQTRGNVSLTAFSEQVHFAIREEISTLPPSQRALLPRSTSLVDLFSRWENKENAVHESMLTCIYQLGCFINYYGGEQGREYPSSNGSYATGLCTGLLAAAAISSSRTMSELIPAAVHASLVALRMGIRAHEMGVFVDPDSKFLDSWSIVVKVENYRAEEILAKFCQEMNLTPATKPYISAISHHNITISGPPQILHKLIHSALLSDLKATKVAIHAPYHAAHLYRDYDLDVVLQIDHLRESSSCRSRFPIISSSTGVTFPTGISYVQLLQNVAKEILLQPLNWTKVVEGVNSLVVASKTHLWTIVPIATPVAQSLASSIRKTSGAEVSIDSEVTLLPLKAPPGAAHGRHDKSSIAIVGLSGRFPDAANPEHFWDLLYKGLDVHREVPPDRFNVNAHFDATGNRKNTSKVRYGCWINEPGLFDARFFNISPREAAQADPGQRLALQTAYEALEMAGIVPDKTPSTQRDRVGIFYGMTSDDWREVNSGQNVDTYFIPGGNRAFTPGRINYYFKFSGPSVSVDTACSSSLAAIHLACNSLWTGDCDTAIAGGTNVMTNPDNFAGLDRGHFLSRTGNCKTFDDEADGYCRADGVGTVILKRLEDATKDNDPILGVILGAYTNHSAESVSITRPHVGAQQYIFSKLLNDAGVKPHDISYVEMHGTGTQAGDGVEMKSVLDIFAPDYSRKKDQPLHLGSAKANIGHGESASGVTALIKVLLMMQKNLIPPHCGIKTKINHTFPTDFDKRNVHIAMKPKAWIRHEYVPRRAFVNNFSAAGGNSAVLLQDAYETSRKPWTDPRSAHLVAISAKSITSLKNNMQSLSTYIESQTTSSHNNFVSSLSYTSTARRIHYPYRIIVSGATAKDIKYNLDLKYIQEDIKPIPAALPIIGFVFTGQGAQYAGMGRHFFNEFQEFRSDILRLDGIALNLGFPSFRPLIDGSLTTESLDPVITQLGTTCLQIALARMWSSFGLKPDVVLGHSLGEYAALNIAGVLSTTDTIYLCGLRAQMLQQCCKAGTHAMLAVKAGLSDMTPHLMGGKLEIACSNGPCETVISGLETDIDVLCKDLSTLGLKFSKLNTPYAFHSAQVDQILESFERAAQDVEFHVPNIPIISAVTGDVIMNKIAGQFGPKYLVRHCRETVNFMQAIKAAKTAAVINEKTIWIELGPHPVCSGMIKANINSQVMTLPSMRRNEDVWKVLTESLSSLYVAGLDIDWREYHRDFLAGLEVLPLPTYSWDNKNYWIQYEHDWTLTKGDPLTVTAPSLPVLPTFLTISVQRIIQELHEESSATVVIESDFSHALLKPVALGHRVNGTALCPSSLYADVAQTLGSYLLEKYQPEMKHFGVDVRDVTAPKPLIIKGDEPQLFRASMKADWTTSSASMRLFSVTTEGKTISEHASCVVHFADSNLWAQEWQRNAYLIHRSIRSLQKGADEGQNHRVRTGMAYKLFASLVEYDKKYQAIQEVILDSEQYEATAIIKFQAEEANFHRNPFWIDSIGHLTGFVLNANDATSRDQVYINHGWKSMRCSKKFAAKATYRTYVKMQLVGENMYAGDLYALEDDVIIAVYEGVKFQGIPRRVLNTFLPPQAGSSTQVTNKTQVTTTETMAPFRRRDSPIGAAVAASGKSAVQPNILERALSIMSVEMGVKATELTDDLIFADYGVDSLLSLTILGKFREELEIDASASLFSDCLTFKDLRDYLLQYDDSESDNSSSAYQENGNSTEITTPAGEEENGELGVDVMLLVSTVLAEEIGVKTSELKGDSNLSDLGMDSLLSLTVLGRLREELEIDLPSEFFAQNPTMDSIRSILVPKPKPSPITTITSQTVTQKSIRPSVEEASHPSATSILLQGNSKTATDTLFLFPDGSGSSTSYAVIPALSPTIAIYGLNCPYIRHPENLTCSLQSLTTPYLAEIRRRQPHGPYNLGGWSAGGISAFDAAQQLWRAGEKTERLILLDSPNPVGIEKLPPSLYDYFSGLGLFGTAGKQPPKWLIKHFLAFIEALDKYRPVPYASPQSDSQSPSEFPAESIPRTFIAWATEGVIREGQKGQKGPDITEGMEGEREIRWLCEKRTEFGGNGWDGLLGGLANLTIEKLQGVNHFDMMEEAHAALLGDFLKRAMK